MTESNRYGRQRLAWAFLFASFFSCLFLSVSIPLAVNAYIQSAKRPLDIAVQANLGTVGIEEANGPRRAVLAGEPAQNTIPPSAIRTDTTASALVTIAAPGQPQPLAILQVSSNATVEFNQASAPRFKMSRQPHRLDISLQAGRVRLDIPDLSSRELEVTATTLQGGQIDIVHQGRYMLEVNHDTTQITVQGEGEALVASEEQQLVLGPGQRAEIPAGSVPRGPFDPARDLINNGDFSDGLDNWALFSWQVELEDQPKGETTVQPNGGDPLLRFSRQGIGHADVRITQSINQDVSDYESLRLSATLRIVEQSLGVCGVQGSECPLFIIINYIDESGVSRVWQHGFFAQGTVDDNLTPGACISCAVVQRPHERVPLGQLYFYDVDLLQELATQGFLPPRVIESVTIVGSGHSFTSEVSDISLIVE